jgi:rRNA maturation endonuclease Nob1
MKTPKRYCGACDVWVPASQTICKACGADTEKAAK